jgi:hypothetical protein
MISASPEVEPAEHDARPAAQRQEPLAQTSPAAQSTDVRQSELISSKVWQNPSRQNRNWASKERQEASVVHGVRQSPSTQMCPGWQSASAEQNGVNRSS